MSSVLCVAGIGLFPVVFNLATRATITSNATCGEKGPENFCKLVQHVLRRPTKHIQCATCDAYSLDPLDRHPIQQAIDGSNRWWQSPSISRGILFHTVTITLDLGQVGLFFMQYPWFGSPVCGPGH